MTPLQLARLLRGAAADKKAWDSVVIDVRDQTSIADYFVICEGETDRQVRAIADGMVEAAKAKQLRPMAVDGYQDATWILLDFDSVLAHVFLSGRAVVLRPGEPVGAGGEAAAEGGPRLGLAVPNPRASGEVPTDSRLSREGD